MVNIFYLYIVSIENKIVFSVFTFLTSNDRVNTMGIDCIIMKLNHSPSVLETSFFVLLSCSLAQ